ncbi:MULTISPECIES: methionyl aminopeptidase [unclassified Clostridioides]|uniref:methionyl aminopeptidase n=1 Tax=unclassified Clostridioides TaxID=2635829 RepID=UPI001D100F3D|nr:methionyl aminopeptidase [Clostridioides sp. ZZV15-6388]MCC0644311.1 methionyl aminopeptidase [Clostridioides sp. ZZV14-6150]MCC0664672.1 methionyl aminopeptidase [Clostridioides sp. ZZV15-6597]MCC0667093.1 methionyl aminopeptidase [Clostridioides sp. ZZV14-6153]MCC0723294.1 methionyl aminopeptidase [Clostridioides sp. ZZV14-6104]MCC0742343.1 methionyl aminopeptidase [Clostridioides sp. ZZV14-6044]MCC0750972.1 methionyl aminopeptidase [Clostridioides sp. ZZV13-5731]WLD27891.1 Methionine a
MKLNRNDACWCGSTKKYKKCHMDIDNKINSFAQLGHIVPTHDIIKNATQIEEIKKSAVINTKILDYISDKIKVGMSTEDINELVHNFTLENGAIPAPLDYNGFPKSVCTSINNEVCHGIPSKDIILKDGDIINVDVSTIFNGYYSDASRMFMVGNVKENAKKLVQVTKECIQKGLEAAKPWGFLGDIGDAINSYAKENGYSVVREIGGHGVGLNFHEDPFVSYVSKKGTEMLLVPGMIFTIEPMVNEGTHEIFVDEENDWTIYTKDGKLSAQWECMILVTETGAEILTQ